MRLISIIKEQLTLAIRNITAKENITIMCRNTNCRQKLRLPKVNKLLHVNCPACGNTFDYISGSLFYKLYKNIGINIRNHPLLTGLAISAIVYISAISYKTGYLNYYVAVRLLLICFIIWYLLVKIFDNDTKYYLKWYQESWFIILMLWVLAPVGIVLLWTSPQYKKYLKAIVSLGVGAYFLFTLFSGDAIRYTSPASQKIADIFKSHKEIIYIENSSIATKINFVKDFLKLHDNILRKKEMMSTTRIIEKWGSSIGLISAKDDKGNIISQGSGFIITENGAVVTNHHVVESATKLEMKFIDGKKYENISLLADYPNCDITILKIEKMKNKFKYVIIGNSDFLKVGDSIIAIGNPGGWENTVSDGLISGKRKIEESLSLLQISAPVSPGSSGGPIFNKYGEVVGIVTLGSFWQMQNLNFAVPVNKLRQLIYNVK